jgi:hypothetical protein
MVPISRAGRRRRRGHRRQWWRRSATGLLGSILYAALFLNAGAAAATVPDLDSRQARGSSCRWRSSSACQLVLKSICGTQRRQQERAPEKRNGELQPHEDEEEGARIQPSVVARWYVPYLCSLWRALAQFVVAIT